MDFPLNELQEKLGYKFENLQLLHEALTHDFFTASSEWDIFGDGNVFYKKRKLHRLKCVGVSVLKLLSAEKAVIAQHVRKENGTSDEGIMTRICQQFMSEEYFRSIGNGLSIWEYIYTRNYVNPRQPSIQKEVIQAIYGAIFIDAGGCDSNNFHGMNSVRNLFDLLFTKYLSFGKNCVHSKDLYKCFDVKDKEVGLWLSLIRYQKNIKENLSLEEKIGYKFISRDIINTALTHDSIKNYNKDVPNYEALEFLGDAVYELVMCEYLFWNYINDVDGKYFNFETLRKFVQKKYQIVIANGLRLYEYIIKSVDSVTVTDTHDFLESLVGAIYVDSKSLSSVKKVLVDLCRQFEKETVETVNTRLPFALKTYYGSWHYRQHGRLEERITEEHEHPPKRQDVFRIINYHKLDDRLRKYYQFRSQTGTIQSCDSKAKIVGSESWCNQQEFGRVSLFETWIRNLSLANLVYEFKTLRMRVKQHTHNNFDDECMFMTEECALTPSSRDSESNPLKEVNISQPNFKHVRLAGQVITVWIFNWVLFIFYKFAQEVQNIGKFVLSTVVLIIFFVLYWFLIYLFIVSEWQLRVLLASLIGRLVYNAHIKMKGRQNVRFR